MTAESFEIRLLGPLQVVTADGPLSLGGARQRALLALLALRAGELVTRDRLIDELWGGEPLDNASNALAALVARVRKVLPADVLVTHAGGYELRVAPDAVDLVRFERLFAQGTREALQSALDLWRGPALAEFAYESWAQPVIGRLDELRLAAVEARIQADLAAGAGADLVGELETLVREHPLRERLRAQLMLALYRAGRQADALAAYRDARRALVDELGIEPGAELQELEQAILRHDAALVPERAAARRAVLACALNPERAATLLELAKPLVAGSHREVILLVVASTDNLPEVTRAARALAESAQDIPIRAAAFTSAEPGDDVVKVLREHEVDLLLIHASGGDFPGALAPVLERALCDVAILFGEREPRPGPVIVPFGGAEHEWAAVEVGAWLAGTHGSELRLAGTTSGPGRRDASRLLATASLVVQNTAGVTAEPLLIEPGVDGIVESSRDAGLLVIGLPDRWREDSLGETRRAVAERSHAPVLVVRGGLRPGGLAPRASLTRYTWSLSAG